MASIKDTEIVKLTCSRCGSPIEIKYGTYRKTRNDPHYCRTCRGQMEHERINSLPEKERTEYLQKKNSAISKAWNNQSPWMKDYVSDLRKANWANDPERKTQHSIRMAKQWSDKTQEEKDNHVKKMNEGKVVYWSNPENKEYHSNRAREKWYNQSQEEQDRILLALDTGRKYFLENVTKEEKEEILRKQSVAMKKYWANLSDEEYEKRISLSRKKLKEHFNSLGNNPNKNESQFISYLNMNNIKFNYQYYSIIKHPNFDELFPINTATGSKLVSPYHVWDFILHTKDGLILVDVDGSVHDPKKATTGVTMFNDSKRPYQTDGFPAYAILCYDDKLTKDTPVLNIKTNEKMSFESFMYLLEWMNLTDKEKRELLNFI